jgi:hypothetical protein
MLHLHPSCALPEACAKCPRNDGLAEGEEPAPRVRGKPPCAGCAMKQLLRSIVAMPYASATPRIWGSAIAVAEAEHAKRLHPLAHHR